MLFALAGCQPFSKSESIVDAEHTTSLKGRVAIQSPEQSFNGLFVFRESGGNFELTLRHRLAPLSVKIFGTEEAATIKTSTGQVEENVNLNLWLEDEFDVRLPFLELWRCLTLECSLISEGAEHQYDQDERLTSFQYKQWTFTVEYADKSLESKIVSQVTIEDDSVNLKFIFENE